ncbi:MAG TPA: hypothetical protein VLE23_09235 [Geminicoccaceae bacterium]|nr:hypothetical protein [Geminicoccaceae bacterium]
MGRSLASIIVLVLLALLGACVEVVPRSSVPFHASEEREIRYAAEMTLAVKENRRDEVSEAAANGRVVLPQMPEIWASSRAYDARERAAEGDRLALLDRGGPTAGAGPETSPPTVGCGGVWWARRHANDCPGGAPGAGPELGPLLPAAIAPAAAGPRAWPIPRSAE